MALSIGDQVRFLNDQGGGTIRSFPRDGWAMVEDESGFAFEHPLNELVRVKDPSAELGRYHDVQPDIREVIERNIDKEATRRANEDFKKTYKGRSDSPAVRKGNLVEVDLHIHELLDRHEGMTPTEIISIQLEHFERMLRNAEEHKTQRVIFIHGVGQGVLRAEIRKMLNQFYPHCEFLDAPYHIYGYGATEVRIRPNWKV